MIAVKLIDGQLHFEPDDGPGPADESCPEGHAADGPEAVVTALAADACTDFDEMWRAGRVAPAGTLETDRDIFVLGAAYGLAWAMAHFNFQSDFQSD